MPLPIIKQQPKRRVNRVALSKYIRKHKRGAIKNYILPMNRLYLYTKHNLPELSHKLDKSHLIPLLREEISGIQSKPITFKKGIKSLLTLNEKTSSKFLSFCESNLKKGKALIIKPSSGSHAYGVFKVSPTRKGILIETDEIALLNNLREFLSQTNSRFIVLGKKSIVIERKNEAPKAFLGRTLLNFYSRFLDKPLQIAKRKESEKEIRTKWLEQVMNPKSRKTKINYYAEPYIDLHLYEGRKWEVRIIVEKRDQKFVAEADFAKVGGKKAVFSRAFYGGGKPENTEKVIKKVYKSIYPDMPKKNISLLTKDFLSKARKKSIIASIKLEKIFSEFIQKYAPDYPLGRTDFKIGDFDFVARFNPKSGRLTPEIIDFGVAPPLRGLKAVAPQKYKEIMERLQRARRKELATLRKSAK